MPSRLASALRELAAALEDEDWEVVDSSPGRWAKSTCCCDAAALGDFAVLFVGQALYPCGFFAGKRKSAW